jgi:hypothetical protein
VDASSENREKHVKERNRTLNGIAKQINFILRRLNLRYTGMIQRDSLLYLEKTQVSGMT